VDNCLKLIIFLHILSTTIIITVKKKKNNQPWIPNSCIRVTVLVLKRKFPISACKQKAAEPGPPQVWILPSPTLSPCWEQWPSAWDFLGSRPPWTTSLCRPTSHSSCTWEPRSRGWRIAGRTARSKTDEGEEEGDNGKFSKWENERNEWWWWEIEGKWNWITLACEKSIHNPQALLSSYINTDSFVLRVVKSCFINMIELWPYPEIKKLNQTKVFRCRI